MKLPDAWKRYKATRDNGHSLTDTPIREAAITRARFRKAQALANVLGQLPADWPTDAEDFSPEQWSAALVVAGIADASPVTRVLAVELLRDRALQREGLMDEDEAREFCTSNFTPAELFGRP